MLFQLDIDNLLSNLYFRLILKIHFTTFKFYFCNYGYKSKSDQYFGDNRYI